MMPYSFGDSFPQVCGITVYLRFLMTVFCFFFFHHLPLTGRDTAVLPGGVWGLPIRSGGWHKADCCGVREGKYGGNGDWPGSF